MAEVVDTSIYKAHPEAAANPIGNLEKMMGVQHAINQNQQFQQEFKARQALGPLMQQSVDPTTGEFDLAKMAVLGSANPDVAWKLPELMNQIITRKNMQANTVATELGVAQSRYKTMGGVAASLLQEADANAATKFGPDGKPAAGSIDPRKFSAGVGQLLSAGIFDDPKDAAAMIAGAPSDPKELYNYVKRFATSAADVDHTMEAIRGTIAPQDLGGVKRFVRTSPATGRADIAPGSASTLEQVPTAPDRNALVKTGVDANGRDIMGSRSSLPMQGGGGTPLANAGQGAPGAVSDMATTLSPSDAAALKGAGEGFVTYHNEVQTANQGVNNTLRTMDEMKNALKEFKSGGGMEVREKLASLAQGLGADNKLVDKIMGGNLGAVQEFVKLSTQYATNEMKTAMGSSQRLTNLDFATFLKNNPTITTDPRAMEKMFNWIKTRSYPIQQEAQAMDLWKAGKRPKGLEGRSMDAFPAWWAKTVNDVRDDEQSASSSKK